MTFNLSTTLNSTIDIRDVWNNVSWHTNDDGTITVTLRRAHQSGQGFDTEGIEGAKTLKASGTAPLADTFIMTEEDAKAILVKKQQDLMSKSQLISDFMLEVFCEALVDEPSSRPLVKQLDQTK